MPRQISLPSAAYFMWAVRGDEWVNGWPKRTAMRVADPTRWSQDSHGQRPHLLKPDCWCIPTEAEDGVWLHHDHVLSTNDACRMAGFTRAQ